jgi:hypothetical protein
MELKRRTYVRETAGSAAVALLLVFCVGSLHADAITYDLIGTSQWTNVGARDSLGLNGASFNLSAQLTNFTPTFVTDPNVNARADYVGIGILTLGPLTPLVNRVDFSFIDAKPSTSDDFTIFAARTTARDYLFASDFNPTANDVLVPPPTYPGEPVLFGSLLVPGATASQNIVYNFLSPQLTVTSTPEPSSFGLLGFSLLLVGVRYATRAGRHARSGRP